MNQKSKSCSLKGNQKVFYLAQNRIASCCRAKTEILDSSRSLHSYITRWNDQRQQLDAGIEIIGCEHCWQEEKQNKISYRLLNDNSKNTIELFLSNLCNQMCSYCNPKSSSTWQKSIEEFGMFQNISLTQKTNLQFDTPQDNINYWLNQIIDYINGCPDQSVILKIVGGEPLMQQRNLERMLSLTSSKIKTLAVQTNLNPPKNKFLQWLVNNVDTKILDFIVSIDSSPEYNHWPRALFDQEKFLTNLDLLQQHKIKTRFTSVISVLSVFDLHNFITWTNAKQINTVFYKLQNPKCLDPALIPVQIRQKIWNSIEHLDPPRVLQEVLQQPDQKDRLTLFEQYHFLDQYFKRNQLDPSDCQNILFKEYWSWLQDNYKK